MRTDIVTFPNRTSGGLTLPPGDLDQPAGSWAVQAAQFVFKHYAAPDVLDVPLFFRSAGAALADFPVWVIVELVNPATGILGRQKWTPKIAELVRFCESRIQAREWELHRKAWDESEARFRQAAAEYEAENKRIDDIRRAAMTRLDGCVYVMRLVPGMYQVRHAWECTMVRETVPESLGEIVDILNENKDLIAEATKAEMKKAGTGWTTIQPTVFRLRATNR